jgi:hypothetical protein
LKRQKVLRAADKKFLSVYDFMIGQQVNIFAKMVHLYDCDQYTREFYESLGVPQQAAEQCPVDNFNHSL